MADDLKIQVTAELDEASSAAKIKSQLGTIESSIKKEPIKPKIEFDQAQISNLAKSIQAAMAKSPIKAKIDIDVAQLNKITSTIRGKIESSLKDIKLPIFSDVGGAGKASSGAAAGAKMPKGEALSQTSRQYDTIIQKVKEFNRLKGQDAGELIDFRTTASGADGAYKATLKYQAGLNKTIDYVVAYNAETQEAIVTQTRFADALGKTEAARQKQIENTKNFTQKYQDELKKVFSKAYNQDNPLSKEFSGSFDALFQSLSADIQGVGEVAGTEFMRGFKSKFADLNLALLEAKKAQWGATDFSSKDVTKQIVGAGLDIDIMEGRARAAGMATADVTAKVGQLRAELAGVSDMPGLQALGENVRIFGKEIEAVKMNAKDWNVQGIQKALEIDTKQIAQLERLLSNPALMNAQTPGLTAIRTELERVYAEAQRVRDAFQAGNLDAAQFKQLDASFKELAPSITAATNAAKMFDSSMAAQNNLKKMSTELKTVQMNIDGLATKYSAFLKNASARGMYESLKASSANADVSTKVQLQKEVTQFTAYLKNQGLDRKSLWDETKANVGKFSNWFGIASVVTGSIRTFNQMVDSVSEVNKQMTELKKVTDETDASYAKFLKNAGSRSKDIGTDLADYVKSTADWARMGKSMEEAQLFGETSNILYKVGDEFSSVNDATNTLITTTKAYGVEAANVMSIVDKLNAVSNKTSASSGGLSAALQRSASALAMAGTDLDKSIALIVAGNETVRDYEVTGTAIRSMALRMRGAETDLKNFGEEVDEFVQSTPKLRAEIKALSGVDIMKDENTFKDIYDVLQEISKVQDKITDVSMARIMEVLFGKRQANVGASILQNFKEAERSVEIAQNSAGSAMAEHAKWMQSIEAAQMRAKSAFQDLSNTVMSSGLISGYYDAQSGLLGFITQLIGKLGAIPTLATAAAGVLSAKNFGIYNMPMPHSLSAAA